MTYFCVEIRFEYFNIKAFRLLLGVLLSKGALEIRANRASRYLFVSNRWFRDRPADDKEA
jgi:hypothetical protein